jgi:hypothetical protein
MDLSFLSYLAVAAPVPEPATYLLLPIALALIVWRRGRARVPASQATPLKVTACNRDFSGTTFLSARAPRVNPT